MVACLSAGIKGLLSFVLTLSFSLDIWFEPDTPVSLEGIIVIDLTLPYFHWNAQGEGITGRVAFFEASTEMYATQTLFLHFNLRLLLLIV